ncbi:cobalt ABC transporter, inner membrane subunit CbiQ [Chlorobium limicola DSM 245]|uniref:Cobalt ABC transporter, inner membrane subunit CbiQ n=1 Tax=Chlorobium limicola (strain DSM 245 / NBRC 103803 / 6330) TaxID=290315 RepID=B3EC56_CHLL2|nr:cobalt ECF transporter T component CbiQ [Chlorobium limicola]ACD90131.1 cobalt ABC transporter, inner membrane subunit CbiQ [Chlorobium limicola DSM 245]
MITLDRYTAASPLRRVDPLVKLSFALPPLLLCLWADRIALSLLVLLAMGAATVFAGRVSARIFIGLLALPLAFLFAGAAGVAVDFSPDPDRFAVAMPVGGVYAGLTASGLDRAFRLFFRAMGSVSCMYFIALTTPPETLFHAARRLRVPELLIEMAGLVYRFLFILLDSAGRIRLAQESRLGYVDLQASFRSLAVLSSALFLIAARRADECYTALECRGYEGTLRVLHEPCERPRSFLLLLAGVHGLLAVAILLIWRYPEMFPW